MATSRPCLFNLDDGYWGDPFARRGSSGSNAVSIGSQSPHQYSSDSGSDFGHVRRSSQAQRQHSHKHDRDSLFGDLDVDIVIPSSNRTYALSQRIEEFVHEFGPISLPDPGHYPSYTRTNNRFKNYMLGLDDVRVDAKQLHSGHNVTAVVPGVTLKAAWSEPVGEGAHELVLLSDGPDLTVFNKKHALLKGGMTPQRTIGPCIFDVYQCEESESMIRLRTMEHLKAHDRQYTSMNGDVWKQVPPNLDLSSSTWTLKSSEFPNQIVTIKFQFNTAHEPVSRSHW